MNFAALDLFLSVSSTISRPRVIPNLVMIRIVLAVKRTFQGIAPCLNVQEMAAFDFFPRHALSNFAQHTVRVTKIAIIKKLGFSENSSGHLNANVSQYEGLLFF